jgi:hypothetical protein
MSDSSVCHAEPSTILETDILAFISSITFDLITYNFSTIFNSHTTLKVNVFHGDITYFE